MAINCTFNVTYSKKTKEYLCFAAKKKTPVSHSNRFKKHR